MKTWRIAWLVSLVGLAVTVVLAQPFHDAGLDAQAARGRMLCWVMASVCVAVVALGNALQVAGRHEGRHQRVAWHGGEPAVLALAGVAGSLLLIIGGLIAVDLNPVAALLVVVLVSQFLSLLAIRLLGEGAGQRAVALVHLGMPAGIVLGLVFTWVVGASSAGLAALGVVLLALAPSLVVLATRTPGVR